MLRYNIAYATDNSYVQHVAVSLVSLFRNNIGVQFDIYILVCDVSEKNIVYLKEIETEYRQRLFFISVSHLMLKLSKENVSVNKLSISTYSRLFLSKLIPDNVENILYLDCDTIVVGKIETIWEYNLSTFFLAGVIDTMYPNYKQDISLPADKHYINAGVLFINLKKWREEFVEEQFIDFIKKYNGKVPHLDQGVINGVFHDKGILDLRFNVQTPIFLFKKYLHMINYFSLSSYYSEQDFLLAKRHPVIIHYSAFHADRPWFKFCLHPQKGMYYKYLKLSPYKFLKLSNNKRSTLKIKIKSLLFVYFQSLFLKLR